MLKWHFNQITPGHLLKASSLNTVTLRIKPSTPDLCGAHEFSSITQPQSVLIFKEWNLQSTVFWASDPLSCLLEELPLGCLLYANQKQPIDLGVILQLLFFFEDLAHVYNVCMCYNHIHLSFPSFLFLQQFFLLPISYFTFKKISHYVPS